MLSIVVIAYFMFNTGFFYEVTGDVPLSHSLSFERMKESTGLVKVSFNDFYTFEEEVLGAKWLSEYKSDGAKVFADEQARLNVLTSYGMIHPEDLVGIYNDTAIDILEYVYLKRLNVVDGLITYSTRTRYFNISQLLPILDKCNEIYSNGGCSIHKSPLKRP
jgi:uncharacterized membrane protein